jgi:putative DNA primase/helicase
VQRSLAKLYDGDPKVAMLTTCARLPGFKHQKDIEDPFPTGIVEAYNHPPYTAAQILEAFPPIEKPHRASTSGRLILDPQDPLEIAKEFVQRHYHPEGALVHGLVYHREDFYRWDGACYTRVEESELEAQLYVFLGDAWAHKGKALVPFKPNKSKISQIVHALSRGTLQGSSKDPPFALHGDELARGMLPCRNGMLDIRQGVFEPHRPEIFNINVLDFDYDPEAPKPARWYRFLRELWPEDKESRQALQEIMGYLISVDTEQQKIFLLVGPKRGGKGTILRVLTGIIGKRNVAAPTFKSLASHFGLQPLIGKTIAAISDARLGANTDVVTVVERMLRISGEDDITADQKYKAHWTGRMNSRFLILTNELPKLTDASATIVSRLVPIIFSKSFYGEEDTQLTDALLLERSGIVNWAMRGYKRLQERGHFVVPESALAAIRQMEDLASPMKAFLRVRCVQGPDEQVAIDDLYTAWEEWQASHGYKPMSRPVFGQHVHAACPNVRRRQNRSVGRYYDGIGLKPKRRG